MIGNQAVPVCPAGGVQTPCYEQLTRPSLRIHAGLISVRQRTEVRVIYNDSLDNSAWAQFVCNEGRTTPGTSVYVLGDDPALGAWNPERAVLLKPSAYPVWSGSVSGLEAGKRYEWKCIKRDENSGEIGQWEDGPNHSFQAVQGFSGIQRGSF